jgi:hypothetical protein
MEMEGSDYYHNNDYDYDDYDDDDDDRPTALTQS